MAEASSWYRYLDTSSYNRISESIHEKVELTILHQYSRSFHVDRSIVNTYTKYSPSSIVVATAVAELGPIPCWL